MNKAYQLKNFFLKTQNHEFGSDGAITQLSSSCPVAMSYHWDKDTEQFSIELAGNASDARGWYKAFAFSTDGKMVRCRRFWRGKFSFRMVDVGGPIHTLLPRTHTVAPWR